VITDKSMTAIKNSRFDWSHHQPPRPPPTRYQEIFVLI